MVKENKISKPVERENRDSTDRVSSDKGLGDMLKFVKGELTETITFPFLTSASKINLMYVSSGWVDYYLAVSAIMDTIEMIYRGHVGERKDDVRRPYSCFEKHAFYDVPKFLYGKVFKGRK